MATIPVLRIELDTRRFEEAARKSRDSNPATEQLLRQTGGSGILKVPSPTTLATKAFEMFIGESRKGSKDLKKLQGALLDAIDESKLPGIQARVFEIARESRSDAIATAEIFAGLANTIKSSPGENPERLSKLSGLTTDELLKFTKSINEALKLSGTNAQDIESVVSELFAGLAHSGLGVERIENIDFMAPELTKNLAKGLGFEDVSELVRNLDETKIGLTEFFDAIENQRTNIASDFQELPFSTRDRDIIANNDRMESLGLLADRTGLDSFFDGAADILSGIRSGIFGSLADWFNNSADELQELIDQTNDQISILQAEAANAPELEQQKIERFIRDLEILRDSLELELRELEGPLSDPIGTPSGPAPSTSPGIPMVQPDGNGLLRRVAANGPAIRLGTSRSSGLIQGFTGQDALTGLSAGDSLSRPFIDSSAAIEAWADQFARAAAEVSGASLPTISEALDEDLVGGLEDAKAKTQETLDEIGQLFDDVAGRAIDRLADEIVDLSLDMDSLKQIGRLALEELRSGLEDLARESLEEVLRLLKEIILQFIQVEILGQQMSASQGGAGNGGANSKGTFFSLLGTVIGAAFSSGVGGQTSGAGAGANGGVNQGGLGGGRILENAEGGTIPIGRTSFVGEAGPELAMAGAGGTRIMPLRRPSLPSRPMRSGGEMIVINQSFDFSRADMNTVGQLRAESERIKRESVALMRSEVLKGGSLARDIGKR